LKQRYCRVTQTDEWECGLDHLDDFVAQAQGLFGATVRTLPGGIVLLS